MIRQGLAIFFGSILIAIGINYFVIPHQLINGGVIGLGLIANYTLGFKPGLTLITLSLPIYIYAWFKYRSYFYNGLHGLLISGFLIDLLHSFSKWNSFSLITSSICGGILIGTGISMMLLVKASTGGGDLMALMIADHSSLNVGLVILIMDTIVILIGGITMRNTPIFHSFIMILVIGIATFTLTNRSANVH